MERKHVRLDKPDDGDRTAGRPRSVVRSTAPSALTPTKEEVQEAQQLVRLQLEFEDAHRNDRFKWAAGPLYQRYAEPQLEANRGRFEAGDQMSLFAAIRICANHDLPLPRWAAMAFIRGYDEVLNCRAGSWDAAFGKPYPKGEHLRSRRLRRENLFAVRLAVDDLHSKGSPKDEAMFESIGEKLGIGKTLAMELYYGKRKRNPRKR